MSKPRTVVPMPLTPLVLLLAPLLQTLRRPTPAGWVTAALRFLPRAANRPRPRLLSPLTSLGSRRPQHPPFSATSSRRLRGACPEPVESRTALYPTPPALPATPNAHAPRVHSPLLHFSRPKIRPKLSLARPNPLWGFGLARDSSPFTPTNSRRRTQAPGTSNPRRAHRLVLPRPLGEGLGEVHRASPTAEPPRPNRPPNSPQKHPAQPQEFFGKNSYAHEGAPFRALKHQSPATSDPRHRRLRSRSAPLET